MRRFTVDRCAHLVEARRMTESEALRHILRAMDADYRAEWPQAAYDWALSLWIEAITATR